MIVVDTSALVEIVLRTPQGARLAEIVASEREPIAPASLDAEVFVALRRLYLQRHVTRAELIRAVLDLRDMPLQRFDVAPLLEAALLRLESFGGHDVFFALLALQQRCALLTRDAGLARAARAFGVETAGLA